MADVTKFITGIANFQQQHFGDNPERANTLLSGQKPQALLIGCCDSRVDPALLTSFAMQLAQSEQTPNVRPTQFSLS